jgi:hypothetical protein
MLSDPLIAQGADVRPAASEEDPSQECGRRHASEHNTQNQPAHDALPIS